MTTNDLDCGGTAASTPDGPTVKARFFTGGGPTITTAARTPTLGRTVSTSRVDGYVNLRYCPRDVGTEGCDLRTY